MANPCAPGTSTVKPTTLGAVSYSSGLIADLLVLVESPWLIPVIPLLTLPPIVTASFCSADPPTMTALTSAEATAILNFNFLSADFATGLPKVAAIVSNAAWYQFCECTSAPTPPPSPAPAAPSGTPFIVLPSAPGVQPCAHGQIGTNGALGGGTFTLGLSGNFRIPGIKTFTYTAVNTITSGTGLTNDLQITQQDGSGATLITHTLRTAPGATTVLTVPADASFSQFLVKTVSVSGTGTYSIGNSTIDGFCTGTAFPVGTSTCPPDPTVMALLEGILKMVTLIQRQAVPFAYVNGTVHSGVSGNGTISIGSAVLGVRIEVTTLPARAGVIAGDPIRYWDIGEVQLGDSDGWFYRRRIDTLDMVWTPKDAQLATLIGYTIPADTVIRITELVREP